MKSKRSSLTGFALLITLSLPNFAHAKGGGVRGGQVLDIDGDQVLFSLLDKRNCHEQKSGYEMIDEVPHLKETLDKVSAIDWYLGFEFRRSVGVLDFCFTGPLKWTDGFDQRTREEEERQAFQKPDERINLTVNFAIRSGDRVYVDQEMWNRPPKKIFNPYTKSEKIIHEMMHRFYDDDKDPMRRLHMQNMEVMVRNIRIGNIKTPAGIYSAFRFNEFPFPTLKPLAPGKDPQYLAGLAPGKKALLFLLDDDREKAKNFIAAKEVDKLWKMNHAKVYPYLAPWDQTQLPLGTDLGEKFDEIYAGLLKSSSLDEFTRIVKKTSSSERDLVGIVSRTAADLSDEKREVLVEGSISTLALEKTLRELTVSEYKVEDGKLFARGAIAELLYAEDYSGAWVPALALHDRKLVDLTPRLKSLIDHLRTVKENGTAEQFEAATAKNALYVGIFDVPRVLGELNAYETKVADKADFERIRLQISRNLPKIRKVIEGALK